MDGVNSQARLLSEAQSSRNAYEKYRIERDNTELLASVSTLVGVNDLYLLPVP